MVLMPGVQGDSPIVGEYSAKGTHVWEYLRENSYIPWGHYAANMAQDAVRYTLGSISAQDVNGLRHLYYQRIYVQLAEGLGMSVPSKKVMLSPDALEDMRLSLLDVIAAKRKRNESLAFNASIWGQNFGFDLSPSGYRLNASHQQIHQQYALVPPTMPAFQGATESGSDMGLPTYVMGDSVMEFTQAYRAQTGQPFFGAYLRALQHNERTDGRTDAPSSLIIYEDERAAIFVPKAQRSQGEIQIITKVPCGNIVEADLAVRTSLDHSIRMVLRLLEGLGVEMMTAFEISKRFDNPDEDFRLLYCFLPKHPQSPGSFTEFQQRWIIGHYPEDFAQACRNTLNAMGHL
jgi:hypothetical protein